LPEGEKEHAHHFVYAGWVRDEESGEEHEIERCSSPGCGEERRRGE
jgi:hypothetical protein